MTPKGHKSSTNIKHLLVTIYGSMTYYKYLPSMGMTQHCLGDREKNRWGNEPGYRWRT